MIERYQRLFEKLRENGCANIFNYMFCKEDSEIIKNIEDAFEQIGESIYIFKQPNSIYFLNDNRNTNHFSISEYWDRIIPKILSDCDFNFNKDEYEKIEQCDDVYGYDLSYHEKKNDCSIYSFNSFFKKDFKMTSSHRDIFRNGDGMSMYHRLCRDTHYSYEMESDKEGETCFIVCDSMVSPVIPILAYYFKKMIVFDVSHHFRINCDILKKIEQERPKFGFTFHTELHYQTKDMFKINI